MVGCEAFYLKILYHHAVAQHWESEQHCSYDSALLDSVPSQRSEWALRILILATVGLLERSAVFLRLQTPLEKQIPCRESRENSACAYKFIGSG